MTSSYASAPGKVILFGEHAVVYGRPAIAVPVNQVQVKAYVSPILTGKPGQIWIEAPDIHLDNDLSRLPTNHPFVVLVNQFTQYLGNVSLPSLKLRVTSTIPVASGLGSGAAVSIACLRALSMFVGHPLNDPEVCRLAYEVEKIHHGTPSGIDNTVITYSRPIFFERGKEIETLAVGAPIQLVIASSGVRSATGDVVSAVRRAWEQDSQAYETLFDQVGSIARQARTAIEQGEIDQIGQLMTANHACLQKIGVSSPVLDRLVDAALHAGAAGAKLSGAGRGGNIIALVRHDTSERVAEALRFAAATQIITTTVAASPGNRI